MTQIGVGSNADELLMDELIVRAIQISKQERIITVEAMASRLAQDYPNEHPLIHTAMKKWGDHLAPRWTNEAPGHD